MILFIFYFILFLFFFAPRRVYSYVLMILIR